MTERDVTIAFLALFAALFLAACGPTALQTHARANLAASSIVTAGGEVVDDARERALDAVVQSTIGQPRSVRASEIRAEDSHWRPVGAALDATRDALIAWADSLEIARLAGEDESVLSTIGALAARVVILYDDVTRLAASLGTDLPALPDTVRRLAVGIGGGR